LSSWHVLAQQLAGAALLGVIYALVAVGFTLYFGVLDVIQFSHGDIVTVGAFAALTVAGATRSVPVIFLVAMLITGVVGIAFRRVAVHPTQASPPLITLLATLAAGMAIREAIRLFYPLGSQVHRFPVLFPVTPVQLGPVLLRVSGFWIAGIGLAAIVAAAALVRRTGLGRSIRAVAQDREAAQMMGVNLTLVFDATFFIASALAALAGLLYSTYYNTVTFEMGLILGVIGFSAAVLGGLGNVYGAIVGGFVFALLETLSAALFPAGSENSDVYAFVVVILFLVFRPTGILGERTTERV
jgi:branched-chain amino acid transport system permease protein